MAGFDWQSLALCDLREYRKKQAGLENLAETIDMLDEQAVSIRGAINATSVQGGRTNRYEERLINSIAERERLEDNRLMLERQLDRIERGLDALGERERMVLDYFYIDRPEGYIDRLCEELSAEKSTVYRIKDDALYGFTMAMYGVGR